MKTVVYEFHTIEYIRELFKYQYFKVKYRKGVGDNLNCIAFHKPTIYNSFGK